MRRILPLILFLAFHSCSHQQKEPSENFLPKDKMIQVLLDIHLTEAMMPPGDVLRNKDQMKKLSLEYEKIFKKNEVTSQEFYSTFNYYLNHPAEMDSTYKYLVEAATQKQSEIIKNLQSNQQTDSAEIKTAETVRKNILRKRKR